MDLKNSIVVRSKVVTTLEVVIIAILAITAFALWQPIHSVHKPISSGLIFFTLLSVLVGVYMFAVDFVRARKHHDGSAILAIAFAVAATVLAGLSLMAMIRLS